MLNKAVILKAIKKKSSKMRVDFRYYWKNIKNCFRLAEVFVDLYQAHIKNF